MSEFDIYRKTDGSKIVELAEEHQIDLEPTTIYKLRENKIEGTEILQMVLASIWAENEHREEFESPLLFMQTYVTVGLDIIQSTESPVHRLYPTDKISRGLRGYFADISNLKDLSIVDIGQWDEQKKQTLENISRTIRSWLRFELVCVSEDPTVDEGVKKRLFKPFEDYKSEHEGLSESVRGFIPENFTTILEFYSAFFKGDDPNARALNAFLGNELHAFQELLIYIKESGRITNCSEYFTRYLTIPTGSSSSSSQLREFYLEKLNKYGFVLGNLHKENAGRVTLYGKLVIPELYQRYLGNESS